MQVSQHVVHRKESRKKRPYYLSKAPIFRWCHLWFVGDLGKCQRAKYREFQEIRRKSCSYQGQPMVCRWYLKSVGSQSKLPLTSIFLFLGFDFQAFLLYYKYSFNILQLVYELLKLTKIYYTPRFKFLSWDYIVDDFGFKISYRLWVLFVDCCDIVLMFLIMNSFIRFTTMRD